MSLEPLFSNVQSKEESKSRQIPEPKIELQTDSMSCHKSEVSINAILRDFQRAEPRSSVRKVKLENLRYRLIRGLKKTLRGICGGNRSFLVRLLPREAPGFNDKFEKMKQWSEQSGIAEFAKLGNGPKVDSQRSGNDSQFTTYNNQYIRSIFESKAIRLIYRLFIETIFSDFEPKSLCARLKMLCCRNSIHTEECTEKWMNLQMALEQYLGADVPRPLETIQDLISSL